MDTKLRELERAALGGDAEAKKRFLTEKLRAGNYYPVMFTFDDLGGGSVYASRWLKGAGMSNTLMIGPVLSVDGILRGMSISVDMAADAAYQVEVWAPGRGWAGWSPGDDNDEIRGTLPLPAGIKAAGRRDLLVEVPRLLPMGVRVKRDEALSNLGPGAEGQRSTFSAICVTLEIWIPGH